MLINRIFKKVYILYNDYLLRNSIVKKRWRILNSLRILKLFLLLYCSCSNLSKGWLTISFNLEIFYARIRSSLRKFPLSIVALRCAYYLQIFFLQYGLKIDAPYFCLSIIKGNFTSNGILKIFMRILEGF
jgi:hypothetical protein